MSMDIDIVHERIKNMDVDVSVRVQLFAIANAPLHDIDPSKSPMSKRKSFAQAKSQEKSRRKSLVQVCQVLAYARRKRKPPPHHSSKNDPSYVNLKVNLRRNSQNPHQTLSLAEILGVDPT